MTEYNGSRNNLTYGDREYYVVNVTRPSSNPRSFEFVGAMYNSSWKDEPKECIFVGTNQGGPTGEVAYADDPVIEGSYVDYNTTGPFVTDFNYTVFNDTKCVPAGNP